MIKHLLAALLSLATWLAQGQTLPMDLMAIATQRGLIGMSVVATCGDQVTDVVHHGSRRLSPALPVTDDTRFRIASISKLVTAMGLMKLHEQGAFSLDDDVSPALGFTFRNPSHPNTPITYRMLLSHRASLQDGTGYANFLTATYNNAPPPPISQLVVPGGSWYTANMWRTEAPGSYFTYSNATYGIVGTLIEAHSGQRFDAYMRQHILLPMGIEGSFNIQDLDDIGQLATLYRNNIAQADNFGGVMPPAPNLSGYIIGSNGLYFAPQGGLRCSALELAQVLRLMHGEGTVDGVTILQPGTYATMVANEWQWNGTNGDNYYGLFRSWGLGAHRITATPGGDVVLPGILMLGHAGEAYGLISDLYLEPATGFGLVFITNGYTPGNNYTFGVNSAFYRVEEEVFAALGTHARPACLSTDIPDAGWTSPLRTRGRLVEWAGEGLATLEAFDATGRLVERATLNDEAPWLPGTNNLLLLRATDASGRTYHLKLP
ncbi:MAG: beta-lactamase family protein [Flavobacteriales bacterium]|nr:beta-lactamase family protein [Flavobacteriales bacterium]